MTTCLSPNCASSIILIIAAIAASAHVAVRKSRAVPHILTAPVSCRFICILFLIFWNNVKIAHISVADAETPTQQLSTGADELK
jgi:hypothetical protein